MVVTFVTSAKTVSNKNTSIFEWIYTMACDIKIDNSLGRTRKLTYRQSKLTQLNYRNRLAQPLMQAATVSH
jgi:hypothetical protein